MEPEIQTAWPWRWRHCHPSKRQELLTEEHCITSQKTRMHSNTAVSTSDLSFYGS